MENPIRIDDLGPLGDHVLSQLMDIYGSYHHGY